MSKLRPQFEKKVVKEMELRVPVQTCESKHNKKYTKTL